MEKKKKRKTQIKHLEEKFGAKAMAHAVLLETNTTADINDVSDEVVQRLFVRYCPIITHADKLYDLEIEKRVKELRSVILKEASFVGLYKPGVWAAFNRFMKNRSVLKKPLNAYKLHEFSKLIAQFKKMRQEYNRRKMIVGTTEWCAFLGVKDFNSN